MLVASWMVYVVLLLLTLWVTLRFIQGLPFMVILGAKEVENSQVSLRRHKMGDIGSVPTNQFKADIMREINEKDLPSES